MKRFLIAVMLGGAMLFATAAVAKAGHGRHHRGYHHGRPPCHRYHKPPWHPPVHHWHHYKRWHHWGPPPHVRNHYYRHHHHGRSRFSLYLGF